MSVVACIKSALQSRLQVFWHENKNRVVSLVDFEEEAGELFKVGFRAFKKSLFLKKGDL